MRRYKKDCRDLTGTDSLFECDRSYGRRDLISKLDPLTLQRIHLLFVHISPEEDTHDQRKDLCKGEGPPYSVQTTYPGEDISCWQQHAELSYQRDPKAEHTMSHSLEQRRRYDIKACEDKADTDDAQGKGTYMQHIFRSIENAQQLLWCKLEDGQADEHDQCSIDTAQRNGMLDPLFVFGSIVVGHDRDHSVIQAEYRHEDKAL